MNDPYSQEYDFPEYPGEPNKIICLAFIPRSASNFLADEMRKTGKLGYPLEYFSPAHMLDMGKWVRRRTSPNGVFSFKWNSSFCVFPLGAGHFIFLDRKDSIAQARSYCIAKKTGEWTKVQNRAYSPDINEIRRNRAVLAGIRELTTRRIKEYYPLTLWFEDVIKDPKGTIERIIEFCEV